MNKGKRQQAITLLTNLNQNYQDQINSTDDKKLKDSLILKIHENEKNIEILKRNDYDFTNVKSVKDLKNVKKKPSEYWD